MTRLILQLRRALGLWLLDRAIAILPSWSEERNGVLRGMREEREYQRYRGYTALLGGELLTFDRWREIFNTFKLRSERAPLALRRS